MTNILKRCLCSLKFIAASTYTLSGRAFLPLLHAHPFPTLRKANLLLTRPHHAYTICLFFLQNTRSSLPPSSSLYKDPVTSTHKIDGPPKRTFAQNKMV